jgi:hypothetical protein
MLVQYGRITFNLMLGVNWGVKSIGISLVELVDSTLKGRTHRKVYKQRVASNEKEKLILF